MSRMNRLIIDLDQGQLVLRDAWIVDRVEEYRNWKGDKVMANRTVRSARGTVESGGMFHATGYTPFPIGQRMEWPLYERVPHQQAYGDWRVSCKT